MTNPVSPARLRAFLFGVVALGLSTGARADVVFGVAYAGNKARSSDPKVLDRVPESDRFETLLGSVGFDREGDITAPGYVLYVWHNGAFDYAN